MKKEYLTKIRSDLRNNFETNGLGKILVYQRGMLGVATDEIDCDYYDWLNGKPNSLASYHGEYMSQYSWSEMTVGKMGK